MRNRVLTGLGPVVGVLVAGGLLTGCQHRQGQVPVPEVAVMEIQPSRVDLTTELPARVSAFLMAEVRPQVNGIILKRAFTEGSDVKSGQLLYQLDPAPYQAALASAQATLAKAEANLPSLSSKAERSGQLAAIHAVGQQDLDDAVAAHKQGEAEILSAKAAVDTAAINLGYTRITAPISGRVGKSAVTVGALATAYQATDFTTIQQLDPVYVDAPQSTAYLLELKRNLAAGRIRNTEAGEAKVKLLLEDGTPYPNAGLLKFSDVTVDPSTGSVNLRMLFPNPNHLLLPGMYARVVIQEGTADHALLVPQQGVTHDPKGEPVAWVVENAKVVQRSLKVDRAIGSKWLVTAGLAAGDQLIMEGLLKVRPGMTVKTVPFHEPAPANATTN